VVVLEEPVRDGRFGTGSPRDCPNFRFRSLKMNAARRPMRWINASCRPTSSVVGLRRGKSRHSERSNLSN
jgi:hypothetical protein